MRLSTGPTMFMTAVLVIFDPRTQRIEYGIAGHPPPLLLHQDGSLERLNGGFYPLGIESDRPYTPQSRDMGSGDALLLYSDGILEATNTDGEPFGLERLSAAFTAASGVSAVHVRNRILAALVSFAGGRAPEDDVTIVVLRVGKRVEG
jgi:phosphoserine phosphatase RsbU/P